MHRSEAIRGFAPVAVLACLGLAALSLLFPSVPTTDPWGWITWGREVAHGTLNTDVGGSPSWKPLPVFFTAPLALFGHVAPDLWLIVARTAGLLGLVLAYRLARRAVGNAAGHAAGVAAVVLVVLSGDWVRAMAHGYSEPMLDALLLLALERHLVSARRTAFGLLLLGSLIRPETIAFAGLYGLWLVSTDRRALVPAALALVAVPALWLGGDWIGAGNPLHGGDLARVYSPLTTSEMIQGLAPQIGWPTIALAAVSIAIAAVRRDLLTLGIAGWGVAWVVLVTVLPLVGGPGSTRFLMAPDALLCVAAAVAVGRAAELPRRPALRVAAGAAAMLALVVVPQVVGGQVETTRQVVDNARSRAIAQQGLGGLVTELTRRKLPRCGAYALPGKLGFNRGRVAWILGSGLGVISAYPASRAPRNDQTVTFTGTGGGAAARPSVGAQLRLPYPRMAIFLPPDGAVYLMPVRGAKVAIERPGYRTLYTAHSGAWTAAAVCPSRSRVRRSVQVGAMRLLAPSG